MRLQAVRLAASVGFPVFALFAGAAGGSALAAPADFDFTISYSGSSISGRLIGVDLDANGNATEVDPTSVLLFHVPASVGLAASPSNPYVFVPHTFERSTLFSGTLISTTPNVYGFQVSNHQLLAPLQNLLMSDAGADVTLVFNFGASLGGEGGTATYGIQAEEDALWPAVNTSVSFSEVPSPWSNLGSGLPGGNGVPSLVGSGTLAPASTGSLTLSSAKPSSPAVLFVSLSSAPTPFLGGTLVAFPVALVLPLNTTGSGAIALPFTWPSNVPSATKLYFQYAIQDPAAKNGVALSNAVKAVTP